MIPAPPGVALVVFCIVYFALVSAYKEIEGERELVREHIRETVTEVTRVRRPDAGPSARPTLFERLDGTVRGVRSIPGVIRAGRPDGDTSTGDPGTGLGRRVATALWSGGKTGASKLRTWMADGKPGPMPRPRPCGHWAGGVPQFGGPECERCMTPVDGTIVGTSPQQQGGPVYDPAAMDEIWQEHGPGAVYRRPHDHAGVCENPVPAARHLPGCPVTGSTMTPGCICPPEFFDVIEAAPPGDGVVWDRPGDHQPALHRLLHDGGITDLPDDKEAARREAERVAMESGREAGVITRGPDGAITDVTLYRDGQPPASYPQGGTLATGKGLSRWSPQGSSAPALTAAGGATHTQFKAACDQLDAAFAHADRCYEQEIASLMTVNPGDTHVRRCKEYLAGYAAIRAEVRRWRDEVEALEGPIADGTDAAGGVRERADTAYHRKS
jgi:hypothetical protein